MRERVGVERTILCATRFWSVTHGEWGRRGEMPHGTLLSGVKHVVRSQGFSTAEINKALRKLERIGAIRLAGQRSGQTIRLTAKGGKVGCSTVKLAPWTNEGYEGAALSGHRRGR